MPFVLIDKPRPKVTLVTLNRPERMNAMAFDVMVPLREALEEVGQDNDTRVVVLTGAGHGFCSGADLEDPGIDPRHRRPHPAPPSPCARWSCSTRWSGPCASSTSP